MAAIITYQERTYAAAKFLEGLATVPPRSSNNVYLFMGHCLPWSSADGSGASDTTPPFPLDTVASHYAVWANMMHLTLISQSNCSLVAKRYDWTQNVVYTQYDQNIDLFDPTLGLTPFYILTDDMNVYKCIYNNLGGPSFVKPIGTSTNVIAPGDGYLWKYMYTINSVGIEKFLTNEWMPIQTLTIPDNSGQYQVQATAIPGTIELINVDTNGFGYVTAPAVTIIGDGTGATAVANINNGQVITISMTAKGQNYTFATATVTSGQITSIVVTVPGSGYVSPPIISFSGGGGSGATAHAVLNNGSVQSIVIDTPGINYTTIPQVNIGSSSGTQAVATAVISGGVTLEVVISPPGGHGSDAVSELGGFFLMLGGTFQFDGGGKFTTSNDFRTIGLILNPVEFNSTSLLTATNATVAYGMIMTNVSTSFVDDDIVTGSNSGATAVVLDYNTGTGLLRLVNVVGIFQPGDTIGTTGNAHSGLLQTVSGVAQAGTTNTITLSSGDSAANEFYKTFTVRLTSGTGSGQQVVITDYNSTTKIATITGNWTVIPNSTTHYSIANITYPDVTKNTGNILYIENRRPIQRAAQQLELINPVIDF